MSHSKKVIFYLKILFYKLILKKDDMEIRIKYYKNCGVKIGKNMRTFSHLLSSEPYLMEFGDNITVSSRVAFATHDNSAIKVLPNCTDVIGRIKIGNNCFIGEGSIILPGIELSDNIIVGAGSVVAKSFLKDGVIIAGNPAKIIGNINDYKQKYEDFAFNTKGLSYSEKKDLILSNESKLIRK